MLAEIVLHEADDPNSLVDFLDADALTCQDGREVDAFAVHADAAASGDEDIAIVHPKVASIFGWTGTCAPGTAQAYQRDQPSCLADLRP